VYIWRKASTNGHLSLENTAVILRQRSRPRSGRLPTKDLCISPAPAPLRLVWSAHPSPLPLTLISNLNLNREQHRGRAALQRRVKPSRRGDASALRSNSPTDVIPSEARNPGFAASAQLMWRRAPRPSAERSNAPAKRPHRSAASDIAADLESKEPHHRKQRRGRAPLKRRVKRTAGAALKRSENTPRTISGRARLQSCRKAPQKMNRASAPREQTM